jgi:hypothetical protein
MRKASTSTPRLVRYHGKLYRLAVSDRRRSSVRTALQRETREISALRGLLGRLPLDMAFLAVGNLIDALQGRVNSEFDEGSLQAVEAITRQLATRRISAASDAVLLAHAMIAGHLEGGSMKLEELLAKAKASMDDAADLVQRR